MSTVATADSSEEAPRSTLNRLSMVFFAASAAFLTASVFLIFQFKWGIPFSFINSVLLAAAAALVVPVLAGWALRRTRPSLAYPGMLGFIVANLVIAVGTGLFIF